MQLSFKEIPRQRIIAWTILGALFIYACIILLLSSGTFDSGDGITHYLISRYSWHHHSLFVDEWGKPMFSIISSPFAQFGLKGITFFNILCGLAASYFAYRIAEKLSIPFPYLAIIFTFSAPIYFSVVNSGLTEPLFSLLLILSIWFTMNQRYYMSAMVFSFLPFVRPEYVFVLPLFLFYYVIKRKYFAIFLLPFGTILISLIGFFYYKNLLWLINQNPYSAVNSKTYGDVKGNMFSYIGNYHDITGIALAILIIIGLLWFAGARYLKKADGITTGNNHHLEEVLLVLGCFACILLGHTLVWAMGIFPTLGLYRYMSPLIPLAAIISLRGLQLINRIPNIIKIPSLKVIIAACFTMAVLYSPYTLWYKIPFQLDPEQVVIKKATDWCKQTSEADKKIFYFAPYIGLCLDIDPYDASNNVELRGPRPDINMPSGSILLWDSHFGPNERKMALDTLIKNPNLILLHTFSPIEKFTVLGGMDYGIWVFERK